MLVRHGNFVRIYYCTNRLCYKVDRVRVDRACVYERTSEDLPVSRERAHTHTRVRTNWLRANRTENESKRASGIARQQYVFSKTMIATATATAAQRRSAKCEAIICIERARARV